MPTTSIKNAQRQARSSKRPASSDEDQALDRSYGSHKRVRLQETSSSPSSNADSQMKSPLRRISQPDTQHDCGRDAPFPNEARPLHSPSFRSNASGLSTQATRAVGHDESAVQAASNSHAPSLDHLQPTYLDGQSNGHEYLGATIAGQARVQMGNAQYNCGPGSHINGPSSIMGNMTVNHTSYYNQASPQPQHTISQEAAELELKKALYYDQMDQRKYQLDQVDPASLEWLWTDTTFPRWLEAGQGLYWIQGKPASGKSTLINYLLTKARSRVIQHLEKGYPNPALLYFFFDYRAGTGVANTTIGLLRSLLLQLIESYDPVKQHLIHQSGYRTNGAWPDVANRLLDLLRSSLTHINGTVCGIIDGLDEFTGDFNHLGQIIADLHNIPNLKVCIASRPHSMLSYRLGSQSLTMQKHNLATVRAYAEAAFRSLDSALSQDDIPLDQTLVQQTVQRIESSANGVVLWAKFAVDEVVSAVMTGDRLEDAVSLLDQYPSELSDIYRRILRRLEDKHRKEAGVILFIVTHWETSFGYGNRYGCYLHVLLMSYNRILFDVFHTRSSFRSDMDEPRFRMKSQHILRGLIDFNPTPSREYIEVRLIHKSLDSFIRTHAHATLFHDKIENIFPADVVASQCLALNLITASERLRSHTYLPTGDIKIHKYSLPSSAFEVDQDDCPPIAGNAIPACLLLDQFLIFRHSDQYARMLLQAIRTSIYKHHVRTRAESEAKRWTGKQYRMGGTVSQIFPQIFELIRMRQWRAFEIALKEDLASVSEETKAMLRRELTPGLKIERLSWEVYHSERMNVWRKAEVDLPAFYMDAYEGYRQLHTTKW